MQVCIFYFYGTYEMCPLEGGGLDEIKGCLLLVPVAPQAATKAVLIKSARGVPACMNVFGMKLQMNKVFHQSAYEADIRETSRCCGWRAKSRQRPLTSWTDVGLLFCVRAQKHSLLNLEKACLSGILTQRTFLR